MMCNKLRVFKLLLYKNYLVRKRHWKLGLFIEILIPLLLIISVWTIKTLSVIEYKSYEGPEPEDKRYLATDMRYYIPENKHYSEIPEYQLLLVPDNEFARSFSKDIERCFDDNIQITRFPSEDEMVETFLSKRETDFRGYLLALVFEDKNVNFSATNFKYKIETTQALPTLVYSSYSGGYDKDEQFDDGLIGLQLCVDQSLIKLKKNDPNFKLQINTRKMPKPARREPGYLQNIVGNLFCGFAVAAFLIPLCIETSHASSEKFLGINVLMAMNGVPNYLNLLSWLATGLIFSLFYIVPIVLILTYASTAYSFPFFYYSNSFILWLVLTMNIGHLIAFGMHVSAYFTRSLFMVTGLIILYVATTALASYGIDLDSYEVIPFLGIIFPNILLFRACEEINFYENIRKGIHWNNLYQVTNRAYGIQGSVGIVLLLSFIGIIFHLVMANYIYAINPGKYGVKKGPLYFLKCFKRTKKTGDYDKVENFEFNDMQGKPFEPVAERVYSPGIQIRNLKKLYKTSVFRKAEVYALRGISVDFFQGQITALLGHNGAGKTTMMSILSGMISPSEGLVLVNGKNVRDQMDEIMNDMGLCPQENMLFPQLSVAEQLKFFAMLKSRNKSMSVIESEVTQLLNQLKLLGKRNALPSELSGGQQRRACLGMALVGDSHTLILDEPTSGLDPESKRDIWNILLKMRGQKTILISTHDMEEADVLGDRIAIMHTGQLKSYGTPMFLKKLLGQGNIEVTLSTEPWCAPENVRSRLDTPSELISDSRGKMVLSFPYNDELPDTLDKIEQNKKELGVTGMSVSIITLEKVFLKVTRDNDDPSESRQAFTSTTEKLEGGNLMLHTWKALIYKKATYTLKNISTVVTIFLLMMAALACASLILMDHTSTSHDEVPLKLNMYHNVEAYYKVHPNSKPYAYNYAHVVRDFEATGLEDTSSRSLEDVFLEKGKADRPKYDYHLLVGAEFESNEDHSQLQATAYYNSKEARFAEPISINLVTNAILRNITNDNHSIEITAQQLPRSQDISHGLIGVTALLSSFIIAVMFAFLIYPAVALFVIHPMRESLTNVKHLQKMTGVSSVSYWGTMFVFDLAVFFVISLIFVLGLVVADCLFDLEIFGWQEVFIELGLLMLFAVNILPLVYSFSFLKKSSSSAIKILSLLPLGLVLIEMVIAIVKIVLQYQRSNEVHAFRPIQKGIFLLVPYVSFFHGQVSFFNSSKINGDCRRAAEFLDIASSCRIRNIYRNLDICCDMRCTNSTCDNAVPYFWGFSNDISLDASFLALGLTPLLYFGILLMLEYQVVDRLIAKIRGGMPDNTDDTFEEQVKKVKHEIAYEVCKAKIDKLSNGTEDESYQSRPENGSQQVVPLNRTAKDYVFFVYELRKLYGKFVAVQDISFGVNESQCFGLLGVNGAGKTTTFKMMTGEVIPNHGLIHLRGKGLHLDKNYLQQIGYCPQNDAIIRSLNAYDHLRLFARLRGIPEDKVEKEVQDWINRLNLNVCAVQPSGTYSGGNKRRLNIAMALIGIPNLVLLDEPTTGVDPAARRSLWNTIKSCQKSGQAIILTSHSMEECEALCNRLAIMVDGKFVCIGPSEELKQRFGAGYDIQVKLNPVDSKNERDSIKKELSDALPCEIVDENSGYMLCHVTSTEITWRRMYDVMIELKKTYKSIEDFSVLSSTLEQLFLLFARAANRNNRKTT